MPPNNESPIDRLEAARHDNTQEPSHGGFIKNTLSQLIKGPEIKKQEPMEKEIEKELPPAQKGIFGKDGALRRDFEKAVKKYDPNIHLREEERVKLAKELPTKYREKVFEKDIDKYLKDLKKEKSYATDSDQRIEIAEKVKLLEKLKNQQTK